MEDNLGYLINLMGDSQIILINTSRVGSALRPLISGSIGKEYEIEMDGDGNSRLVER